MKNSIKFINHASIFISNGNKTVLTDPWYSGASFDDGWMLLYENEKNEIERILNNVNYIWISHEHPDHFSIKFLLDYENVLKRKKIKFIFQKTKDQRVINFLKIKNFEYKELENNMPYLIDHDFEIKIQRSDFYDSALIINLSGKKIFNLNDCPLKSISQLENFKRIYGECDFLFTQFSYAAWKGGKENINWREEAAEEKIQTLINQSQILNTKFTIPFASFIKFCDPYNYYLNSSINTPKKIVEKTKNIKSDILFLKPYQTIDIDNPEKDQQGYDFWQEIYENKKNFNIIENKKIYSFETLKEEFSLYSKRIYSKNSKILVKFLSKIKLLNFFQPVIIELKDTNTIIKLDLANDTFEEVKLDPEIEMFSKSLFLIFRQDFGFDTLTVNGCFEEKKKNAFTKMSKIFAIGNLNNLGIKLDFKIIFNYSVIILFLKKLFYVNKKLYKN